ncbi:MAG TPA: glycosyltransferase [Vicinamibacteria bacterium]|nr:glycosyltransferase [Vicinamibacteria bacterium]
MRVLLAVHAFPPRSTAGVEVYTLRLARALRAGGHEALVLCAGHDLGAAQATVRRREEGGVPVVEVNSLHQDGTLRATWNAPEIDRVGRGVFAEWRPDVVHFQHLLNLSSGLVADARRAGARTVLTLHDYWLSCPRDGLRMRADLTLCATLDHAVCARCLRDSPYLTPALQRGAARGLRAVGLGRALHRVHDALPRLTEAALLALRGVAPPGEDLAGAMDVRRDGLRAVLGHLDLCIGPTAFARDRAVEVGADPGRTTVVGLGVATGAPRPRRAGPHRRFGYVGTLAPHKGVHVLIDAFRGLPRSDVSLDLHGSPSVFPAYASDLVRRAAGDPRIRFHGAFREGEQERVLAGLDALVLPSLWWENSPMAVLEGLAAGLAVVASRTGGVPEILAEGSGVLVDPGDGVALTAALDGLARGALLAEPHAAWPVKTVEEGAVELLGLYSALTSSG